MTKYPNIQIPKEVRNAKFEAFRSGAVYFCEDEMEFFRFLPERFRGFAEFGRGFYDHADEESRLPRFLFTVADLLLEFFFRNRVVGFAIVRPDACTGTDRLADQPLGNRIFWNCSRKSNNRLAEQSRSFFQVVGLFP